MRTSLCDRSSNATGSSNEMASATFRVLTRHLQLLGAQSDAATSAGDDIVDGLNLLVVIDSCELQVASGLGNGCGRGPATVDPRSRSVRRIGRSLGDNRSLMENLKYTHRNSVQLSAGLKGWR